MCQELFRIRLRFMKGITLERRHSIAQSVARDFHYQETWSTIRRSWKETTIEVQQMWQELFHIRWRFMKGITLERSHTSALSVARASPIIHQMILKGKWQTPFKYTKCTPESVNVNIIKLGAALSRNDVTFPGERVVSKNLGKVIRWGWGLIVDPK